MYQHTVVSAAPACGVGVPIRSHVQALWSPGTRGGPSQPRQVLGREGGSVPWASSSGRCWASRGSTLLFVPLRSTESAPRRVMTTIQPILALRHVYEPAVQLYRTDSVVSAMANSTLGSPHHHLRKGECAGLESRSNPSSPRFDPRRPRPADGRVHPLQGSALGVRKVQVDQTLQRVLLAGQDAKAFRENARSYNNALSFTSLAALWDQTQVGTLGPPVFRTWLIDPAEATNTRLQGPDSAETRIKRSTLTKLESMLRTKNHFVRELASAKPRAGWDTAKEWVLRLCLPPSRDRRTHNPPTSSTEMAMLICDSDTNTGDRGPQDLILQVHARSIRLRCLSVTHYSSPQRKIAPTSTFLFARSTKLGHSLPKDRDEEEGDAENGDGELKGSRWRVSRSQFFAHYLPNATSTSQSRIAPNVPSWTTPGCDGVRCQTWKASAAHHDDVRPQLTGNQGCTGADKACNRPDLIARVFEAKSGNKRHAGCFGNECKMNGFCFFATVRLSCYFLNFILPVI
ncbi:BQ5605_C009g05407 [Microbotryum silenes-dioicae]|uniref:BQ5605_C009g05407 protein n=1 Tax=Microbotryum silenes-dioicae TaxID=796604 RepID=A0A2X0MCW0_9BASI|nr:BQ5605_C009g05407 [Microbotryum silenes-dioicae]